MTRADVVSRLRHMLTRGQSSEAIVAAEELARAGDPVLRAEALLMRVAGLINTGRRADFTTGLERARAAVQTSPSPDRFGRLYAFEAIIAQLNGEIERCVDHLVRSAKYLSQVEYADAEIACTWHDLAMAYSYVGFHGYALAAMEHSRKMALEAGLSDADYVTPAIRVRLAVWHDHHGDTDACIRVLRDVAAELSWHRAAQPGGQAAIRPVSLASYGYASARLAVLGESCEIDPRPLLASAGGSARAKDLRLLTQICLLIADGQPREALRKLNRAEIAPATLGPAEVHRLTALAQLAAGMPAEAYHTDRTAFRVANEQSERLRELYVEGAAARQERGLMVEQMARYHDQAQTDPLTGLPNRRAFEGEIQALLARGETAMLEVCDLNGFKRVNDLHGHLCGDLVLQRVAAVLARVMRKGDMVARYGGDEFVVLLPGAGPAEARDIARRIVHAVDSEDWASLAPGTPVGVSIGWSELTSPSAVNQAFAEADHRMLRAKAS